MVSGVNGVAISFGGVPSADLMIVVVTSTNVPEIGEVVKAMGDRLEFGYTVGMKLFIECKVVGYLSNMKCTGEYFGCQRVLDQVMGDSQVNDRWSMPWGFHMTMFKGSRSRVGLWLDMGTMA